MDKGNKETIRLDDALKEVFAKQAEHAPQLPADFSQRVADAMQTRRRKARMNIIIGWSAISAIAAVVLLVFLITTSPSPSQGGELAGDSNHLPLGEIREGSVPSDTSNRVFEPIYKQIAQFSASIPDSPNKGFPHRGGTGGGSQGVLDYSKLAPGVYIEIEEGTGDTVYVVITNQSVPAPATRPVLPEVNIAERMQQAEEFGKQLRKEFDSIHLALNK
jgi:hypothetical protein